MSSFYEFEGKKVWFAGAEGSPFKSVTGAAVRYDDIKRDYSAGNLFVDRDFPCTFKDMIGNIGGDSAGGLGTVNPGDYLWCRPQELCDQQGLGKPNFAIQDDDGSLGANVCSALDVRQGSLGDCWYVAAVQNLTMRPDMLKIVIPDDNFTGFADGNYCGAFHFRFYDMYRDAWIDLVIDDQLPAKSLGGYLVTPAFADILSKEGQKTNEFWAAFIEKAYAKLIGTYADIDGGFPSQALENFTGGFSEITNFKDGVNVLGLADKFADKSPYEMFQAKIQGYLRSKFFLALCTVAPEKLQSNDVLRAYSSPTVEIGLQQGEDGKFTMTRKTVPKGYVYSTYRGVEVVDNPQGLGLNGPHAYSVLDAQEVARKDGTGVVFLVKMRNPHGGDEWQGNYSDKDDQGWAQLEKDLRTRNAAGSTDIDEGVFWMDLLADIIKYFDSIEACLFGLTDGTKFATAQGSWPAAMQYSRTKATDSGAVNNFTAFKFEVKQGPAGAARPDLGSKAILLVTVVLGDYHGLWFPYPRFGVYLFKVRDDGDVAATRAEIASYRRQRVDFWGYNIAREVSKWTFVDPGTYMLVPVLDTSSQKSIPAALIGKDIKFAVRVFTENETAISVHEPSKGEEAPAPEPPLAQFSSQIASLGLDDDLLSQLRDLGYM